MGNGTNIGRVRALGSAHSGSQHWLLQRFTAIANLALGLFLLFALEGLGDYSYAAVRAWAGKPLTATALGLFVISSFWHARLGMQVLIEDYVHEHANKFAAMALLNLVAFAGGAFGLLCVIRLALGGA
jgi:succinate dehydrogenase / fumarate reductase membrane anchor subunit